MTASPIILQWGGRVSDGVFVAGAGVITLDADGIAIIAPAGAGVSRAQTYKFIDASDNNVGYFGAYYSTTTECALDIQANPVPRTFDDSHIYLRAGNKTGANIMTLRLDGEASDAGFQLFTAYSILEYADSTGEVVFNQNSRDRDFRIESDTRTHAVFVQGSDGFVGINTDAPGADLTINGELNFKRQDATISSGAITATSNYIRLFAETGTSDQLDTINGMIAGTTYTIEVDSGDTITIADGSGLNLAGSASFVMNSTLDKLVVFARGASAADEISRSNNG